MATIMQKDILIEVVSSCFGAISQKIKDANELMNNADHDRLVELRDFLYNSFPEEVDYEKTLKECKEIKQKYLG